MSEEKTFKTICQYNQQPLPEEDMKKLLEIAKEYARVKNETYQRYGGIRSLDKIYPGYTVQKELAGSGLREQLGLPSVYFNLAVFEALGDIKSRWSRTKSSVLEKIGKNESFTEEEKHYLRFLIKVSNCFIAVLSQKEPVLPADIEKQYQSLSESVNTSRLNRYLCRQVRSCHGKLHTGQETVFSLTERAYRYDNHGIYISMKEKRKRIFIPLTDNNRYTCQLSVKLFPECRSLEIYVPLQRKVHKHEDYTRQVGLAAGMYTMFTTDRGNCYGSRYGEYQIPYAEWLREQAKVYSRNKQDNPGRKKYMAKKHRLEEQLHSYINQELNRLLREEKPEVVYVVKQPGTAKKQGSKAINHSVSLWQRGYIRKRLEQKCREHSVKLVEVLGKDISRECSRCGAVSTQETKKAPRKETEAGQKKLFRCPVCGYETEEKTNTAGNVLKRGQAGKMVNR